jgi:hypothetical protein
MMWTINTQTKNYNMAEKNMESNAGAGVSAEAGQKEPTQEQLAEFKKKQEEMNRQRGEILEAFMAKHGCSPDQIRQVVRPLKEGGESWELIKKTDRHNKVYIAGPMTGIQDYNKLAFVGASKTLQDDGYVVYNPQNTADGQMDLPYEFYLQEAVKMLVECDYIYLLPGWENSKGATLEAFVAFTLGLNFLTKTALSQIIIGLNQNWFNLQLNLDASKKSPEDTGETSTIAEEEIRRTDISGTAEDTGGEQGESTQPPAEDTSSETESS